MVAAQWDNTCGGGGRFSLTLLVLTFLLIDSLSVWWSSAHTYKNAITNELFLLTSAEAYIRTRNEIYYQNALKVGRFPHVHDVCRPLYTIRNTNGVRLWLNGILTQRSCSPTVLKSGMQGSDGLFNDGLDLATCKNNGAVCSAGLSILAMLISHP